MKKAIKWTGIMILSLLVMALALNLWMNKDYYNVGENGKINCTVGDTFKIELDENGSTGYLNCWINGQDSQHVKLIKDKYKSSLNESFGYIGAGGTTTYTFRAISKGTDTLKVTACPTAREGKKCSDFNETNTKPDNTFVITVD